MNLITNPLRKPWLTEIRHKVICSSCNKVREVGYGAIWKKKKMGKYGDMCKLCIANLPEMREMRRRAKLGVVQSRGSIEKTRMANLGSKRSEEGRKRMRAAALRNGAKRKGIPLSVETKAKMRETALRIQSWRRLPVKRGAESHFWKGGITPLNFAIRSSIEYKSWRRHVFDRDDYTCQACGQRGGKLDADHELPFALFPQLRFELLNGRTLCHPCHKKTPTFGSKALKEML